MDTSGGLFTVAHIKNQCHHLRTLVGQLLTDFLKTLPVTTSQDQFVAIFSKFSCAAQPDTTGSASNHHNFIHI